MCVLLIGSFLVGFSSLLRAQGIVQLASNPLLISASFTGSDSLARASFSAQEYKSTVNTSSRHDIDKSQAYYISFDRKTKNGKSAWGGYGHYWKYDVVQHSKSDSVRYQYEEERIGQLRAEKGELGLSYVPTFWKIPLVGKSLDLIPAAFVTYSYQRADLSESKYARFPYDALQAGEEESVLAHQTQGRDGKNMTWNRVGVGSSILLKNLKFFVSYQFAFQFDQVRMDYHYSSVSTELESGETTSVHQDAGSHHKWHVNAINSIACGAYFPKRSNSLLQFVPLFIYTYNVNDLDNSSTWPLTNYFYISNVYYDYTSVYSGNSQNLSLNGRIWKILMGFNMGKNSTWTSVGNYYVGFKAKKWQATVGYINTSSNGLYNIGLQVRF